MPYPPPLVYCFCGQHGGGPFGITQELSPDDSGAAVACVSANTYESVKMSVLRSHYPKCVEPGQAQTDACAAVAVHRYSSRSRKGKADIVTDISVDVVARGDLDIGFCLERAARYLCGLEDCSPLVLTPYISFPLVVVSVFTVYGKDSALWIGECIRA
jgi:hypothetical protein